MYIQRFMMLLLTLPALAVAAKTPEQWAALKQEVNFFVTNDMGRNGYYEQKPVAELMGRMAEAIGPECIVAAGDVHHFDGVQSVDDPLWLSNFESVYAHPELMLNWFPILGNHEYRGNTAAVVDYSCRSRRWEMPARYYSKVLSNDGVSVRLVFIDTTPLIDKYRYEAEKYPDAGLQDIHAQLAWLDSTLQRAKEDWIVCIGHHPIYAQTTKSEEERADLQRRLLPVLQRYGNVALYVCGHIHNFQHIERRGDATAYVVNSSSSLSRKNVSAVDGTVFCSGEEGFSVVAAGRQRLCLYMVDKQGNVIHSVMRTRRSEPNLPRASAPAGRGARRSVLSWSCAGALFPRRAPAATSRGTVCGRPTRRWSECS